MCSVSDIIVKDVQNFSNLFVCGRNIRFITLPEVDVEKTLDVHVSNILVN